MHHVNTQNIHATYVGNWPMYTTIAGTFPDVQWQWMPSGYLGDSVYDTYQDMPDGSLSKDTDGFTGGGGPTQYTVTYKATSNVDGVQATKSYFLTVHDLWERNYPDQVTSNVRENPQRISDWGINNAATPADLTFYLEQAQNWTLSVGFDSEIGKWVLRTMGVNVGASYTYTYNVGIQVVAPNVPPGYGTYLERVDIVDHHDGQVDVWDAGGYVGIQPYHDKVPCSPCGGIQIHMPYTQFH